VTVARKESVSIWGHQSHRRMMKRVDFVRRIVSNKIDPRI
jgi:hypothetical protein